MAKYPEYLREVNDLVKQHLELVDEPLQLAVYYAPKRNEHDAFLFEVLENFDAGVLVTDGDVLEVLYGPTEHFPLSNRGDMLHIVLASPEEFTTANKNNTRKLAELKLAFADGVAEIIYESKTATELTKEVRSWLTPVHG